MGGPRGSTQTTTASSHSTDGRMSGDMVTQNAAPTVEAIVALLGAAVVRVVGTRERVAERPTPLKLAGTNTVTFCSMAGEKAERAIASSNGGVVICGTQVPVDALASNERTLIMVDAPRLAFVRVVEAFFTPTKPWGIHPAAIIDPTAVLGRDVYVGPGASIGACVVGDGSVIHAGVRLQDGTRIGKNVIIHPGTVIGADGFGYERDDDGALVKFPHLGGVQIEDDVEIGANVCIDRGALVDTLVRTGAKIDNFVHIAHNVVVGQHAAVIAHAMIGGSTTIGDYAWIAPSACVRDGLTIGERAVVGLGAVVVKDVGDGETVMGAPARDAAEYKRLLAAMRVMAGESAPARRS